MRHPSRRALDPGGPKARPGSIARSQMKHEDAMDRPTDRPCPPPRSDTKPPSFAVPKLACDCHAHIFGPVDKYPYSDNRSFTPPDASPDAFLKMLGALGIERMVVVQASCYGTDNRRTVDAIAEIGLHRARGVAAIDLNTPDETLKQLDRAGIKAARFVTTGAGGPAVEQLPAVARKVAPFGWHIEAYMPSTQWAGLVDIIPTLPTGFVLDHMGGVTTRESENDPGFKAVLKLLESERCWVKLCGYRGSVAGYPYADVTPLARRLAAHAPDRCVWGSDWPHTVVPGIMPDDGLLLDLLAQWIPDAAQRQRILSDNPARLYGF
jgi:predicted TIM-barrel fold metal-dependent hydrolase